MPHQDHSIVREQPQHSTAQHHPSTSTTQHRAQLESGLPGYSCPSWMLTTLSSAAASHVRWCWCHHLQAKAAKNQKKQLALLQELQQAAAQEVRTRETKGKTPGQLLSLCRWMHECQAYAATG